jgi:hypothetical protein
MRCAPKRNATATRPDERETCATLAEGYRGARRYAPLANAAQLHELPQEREYLDRAAEEVLSTWPLTNSTLSIKERYESRSKPSFSRNNPIKPHRRKRIAELSRPATVNDTTNRSVIAAGSYDEAEPIPPASGP